MTLKRDADGCHKMTVHAPFTPELVAEAIGCLHSETTVVELSQLRRLDAVFDFLDAPVSPPALYSHSATSALSLADRAYFVTRSPAPPPEQLSIAMACTNGFLRYLDFLAVLLPMLRGSEAEAAATRLAQAELRAGMQTESAWKAALADPEHLEPLALAFPPVVMQTMARQHGLGYLAPKPACPVQALALAATTSPGVLTSLVATSDAGGYNTTVLAVSTESPRAKAVSGPGPSGVPLSINLRPALPAAALGKVAVSAKPRRGLVASSCAFLFANGRMHPLSAPYAVDADHAGSSMLLHLSAM